MHLSSKTVLAATSVLMLALLAACNGEGTIESSESDKSVPIESWQKHLRPAVLDKSSPIAIEEEIYVPIYSHIYVENEKRTVDLAATLSFRNIDPEHPIIVKSARYYSTDGALLKEYVKSPVELGPLATADIVIAREDSSGGAGANFIVDWVAKTEVVPPLAEAVMTATGSPQSMSFTSRGIVIKSMAKSKKESLSKP